MAPAPTSKMSSPPSDSSISGAEKHVHVDDDNDTLSTSTSDLTDAELEKTVWRKMDMWILPVVAIFYLLSFLDRSNIANARVAGLQTDLKMTNRQYSMALTVTYIPYIVAELPSNLLLKYVGPDLMLPAMVTIWGFITTMQGVVTSYPGLLACRFFLGFIEGGLFPGLVLYLSFFYPRNRLQIRISTFFASASLSGAFSGLLAYAIMRMEGVGNRPGWAWIFILEGMFTFLFGAVSFFLLPHSPGKARFLSVREREYVDAQLRADGALSQDEQGDGFRWVEVLRCLKLPHVWLVAIAFFFDGTTLYSLAYFEPTIIQGLGYTAARAQLMSVPPFAVSFVFGLLFAYISDRFHCRGLISIMCGFLCLIGFSLFLGSSSNSIQYLSIFFSITGTYGAAPALSTWNCNNSAPHVRRATAVALGFIMSNSGGILATWLLGSLSPAPRYTEASIIFVVFSVGMIVFSALNLWYLWNQNKKKAIVRSRTEKTEERRDLGDRSAWFVYIY